MQYDWVLEFPNSNVCSTIGPGIFLTMAWSIYVYFIYGINGTAGNPRSSAPVNL